MRSCSTTSRHDQWGTVDNRTMPEEREPAYYDTETLNHPPSYVLYRCYTAPTPLLFKLVSILIEGLRIILIILS